jgi:predicted signal transduction protein with EAL and GGDEF domain
MNPVMHPTDSDFTVESGLCGRGGHRAESPVPAIRSNPRNDPDHGRDAIELARHADTAMYQVKESGRDRLQVFQPEGIDDRLTGVYNRPFLEKQVRVECACAQRSGSILSLLLIGLDDFQAYAPVRRPARGWRT